MVHLSITDALHPSALSFFAHLMDRMLCVNPDARASAAEVLDLLTSVDPAVAWCHPLGGRVGTSTDRDATPDRPDRGGRDCDGDRGRVVAERGDGTETRRADHRGTSGEGGGGSSVGNGGCGAAGATAAGAPPLPPPPPTAVPTVLRQYSSGTGASASLERTSTLLQALLDAVAVESTMAQGATATVVKKKKKKKKQKQNNKEQEEEETSRTTPAVGLAASPVPLPVEAHVAPTPALSRALSEVVPEPHLRPEASGVEAGGAVRATGTAKDASHGVRAVGVGVGVSQGDVGSTASLHPPPTATPAAAAAPAANLDTSSASMDQPPALPARVRSSERRQQQQQPQQHAALAPHCLDVSPPLGVAHHHAPASTARVDLHTDAAAPVSPPSPPILAMAPSMPADHPPSITTSPRPHTRVHLSSGPQPRLAGGVSHLLRGLPLALLAGVTTPARLLALWRRVRGGGGGGGGGGGAPASLGGAAVSPGNATVADGASAGQEGTAAATVAGSAAPRDTMLLLVAALVARHAVQLFDEAAALVRRSQAAAGEFVAMRACAPPAAATHDTRLLRGFVSGGVSVGSTLACLIQQSCVDLYVRPAVVPVLYIVAMWKPPWAAALPLVVHMYLLCACPVFVLVLVHLLCVLCSALCTSGCGGGGGAGAVPAAVVVAAAAGVLGTGTAPHCYAHTSTSAMRSPTPCAVCASSVVVPWPHNSSTCCWPPGTATTPASWM